ncbi:hypothetical protein LTS08_005176 [Lithohypha guttulata]|nr:hypothetical protein LTS08_005176 [Lithohypha guttulata]
MSSLFKEIVLSKLQETLGRSQVHRCREINPTSDKVHNHPSEKELLAFESTYAGANTAELMERYTAWKSGAARRNKNCLVCLKSVRNGKEALLCTTCPRVLHSPFLNGKAPHGGHKMHCPLCIKRRWHLVRPVTPTQNEGQSEDDSHMKRIRRYHRWHRYNCMHIVEWCKMHDDGSLESDRRLLISIGAAKVSDKQQQMAGKVSEGRADDEQESSGAEGETEHAGENNFDANDNPPKQQRPPQAVSEVQSQKEGEAAEYYNPDAFDLNSDGRSGIPGGQRQSSVASKTHSKTLPSVVISRASTREAQDRELDGSALSPAAASEHASTVHTGSSSSYISSRKSLARNKGGFRRGQVNDSELTSSIGSAALANLGSTWRVNEAGAGESHVPSQVAAQSEEDGEGSDVSSRSASSSKATLSQRDGSPSNSHKSDRLSSVVSRGRSRVSRQDSATG